MPNTIEAKFTSVHALGALTFAARNVQSTYQQSDVSYFTHRQAGEIPSDAREVLVLQYGSRNFKVGMAKDALPRSIPHAIAHRAPLQQEAFPHAEVTEEELAERLTARYRQARRKPPPNIYGSLVAHNRAVVPQTIPALNDAYGFEWHKTQAKYVTGQQALRVNPEDGFVLRWPIQKGNFNTRQYGSYHAVVDDLEKIWTRAITGDLKIPQRDFGTYGVVLVVPDVVRACEIRALTELVLRQMGFKSVAFILESVSGTFGAGISGALVIDLGAQTTKVACVEDGQITAASQSVLPYGGDHLTQLLLALLRLHAFPYTECDLARWLDFELLDELKRQLCTMDEEEVSSQVYEAYVRNPGHPTRIYSFKVFEERILVPFSLLEKGVPLLAKFIPQEDAVRYHSGENDGMQIYYTEQEADDSNAAADAPPPSETTLTMPPSEALSAADTPMDIDGAAQPDATTAILSLEEAIYSALDSLDAATNPDRLKRALSSVLVIGGGRKVPHLLATLDGLLRSRYPGYDVEFVLGGPTAPVKESAMDATGVAWKGGAVYAKLECISDAWISCRDYEMATVRALRDRLAFLPRP